MDKYKRLLSNTVLFGISSFSSKILVFVLMPFFTRVLDLGDFGDANLITKYAQLLIPLVSIGIANAVIRFGLDKSCSKSQVFTNGFFTLCFGTLLMFCLWPVLQRLLRLGDHTWLLYAYVLMSVFRNLCSQFVRAKQYIRLYAVDGVLDTVLYLSFVVLFMGVFKWGIIGYVLATAVADFCSAVFLFVVGGLHKFLHIKKFSLPLLKRMLRYSLPLIPASMFWWITNTSDHVFVTYMLGSAVNGLYETAYRVPNIMNLFATLFTEAWQLSAVTDGNQNDPGRVHFFSKVFLAYQALLFCGAAGLIYFSKVIVIVLTASLTSPYYPAWQYIPVLVIATIFSCFVSFMGSIYMVEMRSGQNLLTMMAGAVLNLMLNFVLIPKFGPNGAAFATFASYLLVFVLRAVNTRQYLPMDLHLGRMCLNLGLLAIESALIIAEVAYWPVWCALPALILLFINGKQLFLSAQRLLARKK